eukprot:10170595-Karenia_brevis.AAC.1
MPWTTLVANLWQHLRDDSRIMIAHRNGTAMSRCLRQILTDVPMESKHAMPGVGHGIRNPLMRLAQQRDSSPVAHNLARDKVVDETYLCMTD